MPFQFNAGIIPQGAIRVPPAPPATAESTFVSSNSSGTDLAEYTFTDQNIGAADADRYVIVGIAMRQGTVQTITAVTIGGVSAAQIDVHNAGGTTVAFWGADVPTGTTGTIVVTLGGAVLRIAIGVWRVIGLLSTTVTDTAFDDTMSLKVLTATIDCSAGGFIVAMAFTGENGITFTWTGIDEVFDITVEALAQVTGASKNFAAAQTNLAITATSTGNDNGSAETMFAVAMR